MWKDILRGPLAGGYATLPSMDENKLWGATIKIFSTELELGSTQWLF
jgi:hypothetical protein